MSLLAHGIPISRSAALLAVLACLGLPLQAADQDARAGDSEPPPSASFEKLKSLVSPGQAVTITEASGSRFAGRMVAFTSSSLLVRVGTDVRMLRESDLMRVARRDTLTNGTLVGLGIGAGVSLATCGRCHLQAVPVPAAIGAAIGAGIDAMVGGNLVLYQGKGASNTRVTVAPQLASSRRGVSVSVGF